MRTKYFKYDQIELDYLKSRDKKLSAAIDKIGIIKRVVIPDLLSAIVNSIIGQQISTKAHQTIWKRMQESLPVINTDSVLSLSDKGMQSLGLTFRKVEYIKNFATEVATGKLDLLKLQDQSDDDVCNELSGIVGIGTWTAEMIMIFSMQRKNILSYGDLAILRGMRMLYHHRKITPVLFNRYKKRYNPYGSVASLYLWAIAGGAIPEMKDYVPKRKK